MSSWQTFYQQTQKERFTGRDDSLRVHQHVKCVSLTDNIPQKSVVLLGFCSDAGVKRNHGREGAFEGPKYFRNALANMAIHRKKISFCDVGDIIGTQDLESSQGALGEVVSLVHEHGNLPIIIGGGHETAWGHYQGLMRQPFADDLAIINFDAHFDLRESKQSSSGTPFMQISNACAKHNKSFHYYCFGIQPQANTEVLFENAQRLKVHYRVVEEIAKSDDLILNDIDAIIKKHKTIYLSVCLDVFSSAYAPGVSATSSTGLSPWQVMPSIIKLAQSSKVQSMDLVELAPRLDINQSTAKLAANIISYFYENISGY